MKTLGFEEIIMQWNFRRNSSETGEDSNNFAKEWNYLPQGFITWERVKGLGVSAVSSAWTCDLEGTLFQILLSFSNIVRVSGL